MNAMNSYLSAYVDRRMQYIVDEWELSTGNELSDFTKRLYAMEEEILRLQAFEHAASDKLAELETRARNLRGRI